MLTEQQLMGNRPALRRYATALTRNREDRDDLVQSTLCRAWQKRELFVGGDAQAWLVTMMRNLHINGVRKAARESGRTNTSSVVQEAQSAHLLAVEVARFITVLPPGQRDVLTFAATNGESYGEAALALDIPIGTVRSRLSRGRESLRRRFA